MQFRKIKWNGTEVVLQWTESKVRGDEIKHELTSTDAPAPSFEKAMAAFAPIVLDLLELPESYESGLRVTGLSINVEKGDDRLGLVMTCQKEIAEANGPLVLNTPHLRERGDEDGPGFMTRDMEIALRNAELAAQQYLEGTRAQANLFEGAGTT